MHWRPFTLYGAPIAVKTCSILASHPVQKRVLAQYKTVTVPQTLPCKCILDPRTSRAQKTGSVSMPDRPLPRNKMVTSEDSSGEMNRAIDVSLAAAAFAGQSAAEAFPAFDPTLISTPPLPLFSTQDYLPPRRRLDSDDMAQPSQLAQSAMTASLYPPPEPATIKPERARSSPPRDAHRRGYQACQPCRQR
jgi:hypothetical protein